MLALESFRIHRRRFILLVCCVAGCLPGFARADDPAAAPRWYKGNTHAHSFWSDGNDFLEMVCDWYKSHGYDFFAVSDHNCLAVGEKWMPIDRGKRHVPSAALEKCRLRFGDDWLETRGEGEQREVKLKTFDEINAKLGEPDKFLLIQGEEITDSFTDFQVHINAFNLGEVIPPQKGLSVASTIRRNLDAVAGQSRQLQRPILAHLNHPNWKEYDVTAEEAAGNELLRFFEVYNGCTPEFYFGDATHPGVEKLWDIANTIRLARMNAPPLYGIASDDAHGYHRFAPREANPGRGWIVVRAGKLTPEALIEAMNRGDFYASTGIVLRDVAFDPETRTLRVAVRPEPGVNYTIDFIGTLEGVDPEGRPVPDEENTSKRPGRRYSPEIGKVLASVAGETAEYRMTGRELYVRAVVCSDKTAANPLAGGVRTETAWCQPVGWKTAEVVE